MSVSYFDRIPREFTIGVSAEIHPCLGESRVIEKRSYGEVAQYLHAFNGVSPDYRRMIIQSVLPHEFCGTALSNLRPTVTAFNVL